MDKKKRNVKTTEIKEKLGSWVRKYKPESRRRGKRRSAVNSQARKAKMKGKIREKRSEMGFVKVLKLSKDCVSIWGRWIGNVECFYWKWDKMGWWWWWSRDDSANVQSFHLFSFPFSFYYITNFIEKINNQLYFLFSIFYFLWCANNLFPKFRPIKCYITIPMYYILFKT